MAEKVKKLVLEKFSIKRGPAIQRFPFEEGDIKIIKYYSGETLKGKPNGKGIFEVYTIDVSFAKFYKSKKFDSLWKKYSKNFLDKSRGYVLSERHVGNWKLGKKEGKVVAYTRCFAPHIYFEEAAIGRVVVKDSERKFGYGHQILKASIEEIQQRYQTTTIKLSAQQYLTHFYEAHNFHQIGEGYLEDGIPHIAMIKN